MNVGKLIYDVMFLKKLYVFSRLKLFSFLYQLFVRKSDAEREQNLLVAVTRYNEK